MREIPKEIVQNFRNMREIARKHGDVASVKALDKELEKMEAGGKTGGKRLVGNTWVGRVEEALDEAERKREEEE